MLSYSVIREGGTAGENTTHLEQYGNAKHGAILAPESASSTFGIESFSNPQEPALRGSFQHGLEVWIIGIDLLEIQPDELYAGQWLLGISKQAIEGADVCGEQV
jgi:hypothetical protein